MAIVTRGFRGRRRSAGADLPPGQYLTEDFPVLSAGPTPHVPLDRWTFTITNEVGQSTSWSWGELNALPMEEVTVDLHCVTRWSKLGTRWRGVSVETLLDVVDTAADFALVRSYGGYTTNLPVADLTGGQAWIATTYDGEPLDPEHGGPARLLVPHLYLWKSAKWVSGMVLSDEEEIGFWESVGYHVYGDPWREQRYWDS
ncbi:MAG TPA: sulfite oxidase-like oxidoreductase [Jatrophihabitantaceae bacterium]|jgi:DMSO/TMAO reductase YedYZ molybdopterin-dependent catalytic subunit|nr:sulfite oxidase-like oxidoreductase [Jatrophihabitantaceae bacterium]